MWTFGSRRGMTRRLPARDRRAGSHLPQERLDFRTFRDAATRRHASGAGVCRAQVADPVETRRDGLLPRPRSPQRGVVARRPLRPRVGGRCRSFVRYISPPPFADSRQHRILMPVSMFSEAYEREAG
jgi:hypothetical protein